MSFFQTVILVFSGSYCVGWLFERLFPNRSHVMLTVLYGILATGIIILVFWTLIQMIFGLPQLDKHFPLTAVLLGLVFAIGVRKAYIALQERDKLKKNKRL